VSKDGDGELLQRWRAGESAAGEELFTRYFVPVFRFFSAQLSDPADVEDLTQRTFAGCIAGRDRIHDDAAFRGYLFGIARKRLATHFAERPASHARVSLSVAELERMQSSPSRAFARADQQRLLLRAIAALPDDVRSAVEMFYLESRTLQSIAGLLGIPVGTVKSRLFRGRTLLRDALAGHGSDPRLRDDTIAAVEQASQALDE
jgi:RNA polymerase sigma-70 factor (ECF subfamily)